LGTKITFERIIVMPDGQRFIEGVTPKQLPAPDASHTLPNSNSSDEKLNDNDSRWPLRQRYKRGVGHPASMFR
jgi:hypothetical protein